MAKQNRFYLLIALLTSNYILSSQAKAAGTLCRVTFDETKHCHQGHMCIPADSTYDCGDCDSDNCLNAEAWTDMYDCDGNKYFHFYGESIVGGTSYEYLCTTGGWTYQELSGGGTSGGGTTTSCVKKNMYGATFECCNGTLNATTNSSGITSITCDGGTIKNFTCNAGYYGYQIQTSVVTSALCQQCPEYPTSYSSTGSNQYITTCYIPKSTGNDPASWTILKDANNNQYVFSENCYYTK